MLSSLVAFFWISLFTQDAGANDIKDKPKPAPVRVADAPTAADTVKNVQQFYADIKHVTAKFRQQVTSATFGDTKTSDGMVWISKPGKMRWDYYSKPKKKQVSVKKSFISDGTTLWMVDHDNKQIAKKNLEENLMPVAVSFLYGKGDLATDFDAVITTKSKYGAKDDIVLDLTPKKPQTQYKTLTLVVDPTNFRVKQSIIVDRSDSVNHFRFFEPDFDKDVKDEWFKFDPKAKGVSTYREVNMDEPAAGSGSGSAAGSGSATKTK